MSQVQKSVCVFCGAREGANSAYVETARQAGEILARNNWRLVFGAGDRGLMGTVAKATRSAGGRTFGVIPTHLVGQERSQIGDPDIVVTETMHERKKVMFMNSDAVVILPGGAGTLDEFFEGLTWAQLGLHEKPIIVHNIEDYWDPLFALLDRLVSEGFADQSLLRFIQKSENARDLEILLKSALA